LFYVPRKELAALSPEISLAAAQFIEDSLQGTA